MDYKTADGKSLLDKVKKGVILNLLHDLDLTMQILQMLMSIGFKMTVNISSPSFVGFKWMQRFFFILSALTKKCIYV